MDAVDILKQDHRRVEELFRRTETTQDQDELRDIVKEIVTQLSIHAELEEKIIYPEIRRLQEARADQAMLEAVEEHHLLKLALGELNGMQPDDERYHAKIKTVRDVFKHHIEEEENQNFPMAKRGMSEEQLRELGRKMQDERAKLEERGPNLVVTMIREVTDQLRRMV